MQPTALKFKRRARRGDRQIARDVVSEARLDGPASTGRTDLERRIAQIFREQHDACISEFLPFLLSIASGDRLNAVVGLRPAGGDRLFLEQYLAGPVEQAISRAFLLPVDRKTIVEVGNLAGAVAGETYALFVVLARILEQAGFRWIACTATLRVESMLSRAGFPYRILGSANAACLGDRAQAWGRYYESQPQVLTGEVAVANRIIDSTPELRAIARHHAGSIDAAAMALTQR